MGVRDSVNAIKKIESKTGKSIEIIDLRTIIPWDKDLVYESVKKTGRLLIVHEDTITMGFGAEIAAFASNEAFGYLDAPVMRVAAKDSHIPYSPVYENDILPNEDKITVALEKLSAW
jgi:2-oxoisovalerate dehydrogenase E1 component